MDKTIWFEIRYTDGSLFTQKGKIDVKFIAWEHLFVADLKELIKDKLKPRLDFIACEELNLLKNVDGFLHEIEDTASYVKDLKLILSGNSPIVALLPGNINKKYLNTKYYYLLI
jgi:hypothetical protein